MFDEVKRSGFLGTFIKVQKHRVVADIFDLDKEFRDFDEVREMYTPVGEESNLETMAAHQAKPFELLRQFAFAAGDDKDTFKYPTPRIIAGKVRIIEEFIVAVTILLDHSYNVEIYNSSSRSKTPNMMVLDHNVCAADKHAWSKDIEFARQVLAGMNPLLVEALTVLTVTLLIWISQRFTRSCCNTYGFRELMAQCGATLLTGISTEESVCRYCRNH